MSTKFLEVYVDLLTNGIETSPRGARVKELEKYQFTLAPYERFTSFNARKMNFNYLKKEWLWYLSADPFDDMITDHAQMWKDIRQPDGRFFSNYGQYWFGKQEGLKWVIQELTRDPDSRRAVIPMLNFTHLFPSNKDVVCTEAITFRIRDNKLNMTVNMRSNDAIWGMTNDVACFSFLWEVTATLLQREMGTYCHKADSLHVYERHFQMLEDLVEEGVEGYTEYTDCPKMTQDDAIYQYAGLGYQGPFMEWLNDSTDS